MTEPSRVGGIIHTYQRYDPRVLPSPTQPPPDLVSQAMENMLAYGGMRELTEEEMAQAVQLDPSQIAGLGPSLEALMEMLRSESERFWRPTRPSVCGRKLARYFRKRLRRFSHPAHTTSSFARPSRKSSFTIWSGFGIGSVKSAAPWLASWCN